MTLEDMLDTHGFYVEEVEGERRYMTRDSQNRAVFGPRQREVRGLMAMLHGRSRRSRPKQAAQIDADATIVLPTGEELGVGVSPALVRDAPEGLRARWARRLKDREWHRAVQHTAVDVAMWASCLALAAVSLKAAWFVVTL